jgi:hypothetical protein
MRAMETPPALSPRADRIVAALEGVSDGPEGAERSAEIYTEDAVFRDPLHLCRGRAALRAMTRRYLERARTFRFAIDRDSIVESGDRLYFTWKGTFAGRIGPEIRTAGASLLLLRGDRVASHEDYFDVLGAVLGSLPGIGALYRRLTGGAG